MINIVIVECDPVGDYTRCRAALVTMLQEHCVCEQMLSLILWVTIPAVGQLWPSWASGIPRRRTAPPSGQYVCNCNASKRQFKFSSL